MSELVAVHTEKDLFYYLQKLRLLTAKNVNDEKIENSKNVKEEKATFKGTMKNISNWFERGAMNYSGNVEEIDAELKKFDGNHQNVIDDETALGLADTLFKEDRYGLAKLLFASTIILDDEYDYKYVDEGLAEASSVLYGNKETLGEIKKQLFDNYNAIAPNSLSNVQKGILLGVAISSVVAVATMPAIMGVGLTAGAVAAHSFGLGAITLEAVLMSAALTGITYGGMKLYNDAKIKKEFIELSPEKNAFYLALQCTYIQRLKDQANEEEFKEQLDSILRELNTLKSDLDYYLFVEKESTKENKTKIKSFHEFDNRLVKVLGV